MIKNNILLDPAEAFAAAGMIPGEVIEIDSSYVEYYLDIKTDNEINSAVICDSLSKFQKKGQNIYSPCGVEFDCPDLEGVVSVNIYSSDADLESCP